MTNIVVVGSLNMDLVVHMPTIPRPGETLLGGQFATFPGGKGANQAVAAARLGAHVTMIGCVGADAFGEQLIDGLRMEGVETANIHVDHNHATGVALITVDAVGQNSISVASGANYALTAEHVMDAWNHLVGVDYLVMPLETRPETILTAAKLANKNQVKVILNPAPARELDVELLSLVDVIIPNEHETAYLTGMEISNDEDTIKAAKVLIQQGARNVILTLGARGALILEGERDEPSFHFLEAYKVKAVDTTAAGDAFVGAFTVGLGDGMPLIESAKFASAVAALSVTKEGAQPSLPTRPDVKKMLIGDNRLP